MSKRKHNKHQKIRIAIISCSIILILLAIGVNQDIINKISETMGLNIQFENTTNTGSYETNNTQQEIPYIAEENLQVYFIDVGQADSILIMNKGQSLLIDAGNNDDGENVVNFIKEKGITKLDYVVGTHPHEDHIGGLDDVINQIDTENIYMPKIEATTKTFEDVLDAIANKDLKVVSPSKGTSFQIGDAKCETMTEPILDKKNINLSSIIIRLEFGNNSFLFMGDAEIKNENTREWPVTQVLKVGHHGSNTSTSEKFLKQIQPIYGIIMAGQGNSYGLPKESILKRLEDNHVKLYRTDKNGTIQCISDGNDIQFKTEK